MKDSSKNIYKNFCQVNNSYWQDKERGPRLQKILVEGFFAKAGSNYAIRVGSITKTVEEALNLDALVLLQYGLQKEQDKVEIWQSFNLKNFIGLREDIFKNFLRIKRLAIGFIAFSYYALARFLFFIKQEDLFLKLRFAGIVIGDLIYDELVKQNEFIKDSVNKEYQILSIKSKHKEIFKRTFFYLFSAIDLYRRYLPQCYIATHSQYVNYGVLVRYFLAKGVTVIETTDDILFIHDNPKNLPKFHIAVREIVKSRLSEALQDKDRQHFIERKLQKRFCGEEEQVDVKLAYANKKSTTRNL